MDSLTGLRLVVFAIQQPAITASVNELSTENRFHSTVWAIHLCSQVFLSSHLVHVLSSLLTAFLTPPQPVLTPAFIAFSLFTSSVYRFASRANPIVSLFARNPRPLNSLSSVFPAETGCIRARRHDARINTDRDTSTDTHTHLDPTLHRILVARGERRSQKRWAPWSGQFNYIYTCAWFLFLCVTTEDAPHNTDRQGDQTVVRGQEFLQTSP